MLKKIISIALTTAQIAQFLVIAPAYSAGPDSTPEFKLMEGAIALQGETLSQDKLQSSVAGLLKQYNATATATGAQQRLRDAFVKLQLYTPAQADEMSSRFASGEQKLLAQHFTSDEAANRAITAEIGSILGTTPAGAQFSGCTVAIVSTLILGVGGGLALIAAGADRIDAMNSGNSDPSLANTDKYFAIGGGAGLAVAIGLYLVFSHSGSC